MWVSVSWQNKQYPKQNKLQGQFKTCVTFPSFWRAYTYHLYLFHKNIIIGPEHNNHNSTSSCRKRKWKNFSKSVLKHGLFPFRKYLNSKIHIQTLLVELECWILCSAPKNRFDENVENYLCNVILNLKITFANMLLKHFYHC